MKSESRARVQKQEFGEFAHDVEWGLRRDRKFLPSKYFYDERGSELFEEITRLPEYYLTRAEEEILSSHENQIVELLPSGPLDVVELGCGFGQKTLQILDLVARRTRSFRYLPFDICHQSLEKIADSAKLLQPGLEVQPVCGDFLSQLHLLRRFTERPKIVLFLGSSIGNLTWSEARSFLHSLCKSLVPGDLVLLGFDLQKDLDILIPAYSDATGVTREFNFNLLRRINQELGGDFCLDSFRHEARYNTAIHAMESYLISTKDQVVTLSVLGKAFSLKKNEEIHTEYSHKYNVTQLSSLSFEAGFERLGSFSDSREYFVDELWRVAKGV